MLKYFMIWRMLRDEVKSEEYKLVEVSFTPVPVKSGRAAFARSVSSMRLWAASGSRSI